MGSKGQKRARGTRGKFSKKEKGKITRNGSGSTIL